MYFTVARIIKGRIVAKFADGMTRIVEVQCSALPVGTKGWAIRQESDEKYQVISIAC